MKDFTNFDTPTDTHTENAVQIPPSTGNHVDKPLTRFELVSLLGRWDAACGGKPSVAADSPSSRELNGERGKKRAKKQRIGKDEIWTTADVDLTNCMSGAELVAYWQNGSFAMPLTQRMKKLPLPDEELQKRYTGAKWKLRGTRLMICGWIAYAMVGGKKRRPREALVITQAQLAQLCGLEDGEWIGDCLRDLRAWGLVAQDHAWVRHGKASSRRGNVYRLTTLAAYAFALDDRLDVARLPAPELVAARAPRIARNRTRAGACAEAPVKTPVHPDLTPTQKTSSAESLSSPRAREALAGAGVVESTSSTVDHRTAVADESPCLPSLERVKPRTATLSAGSTEPESREAATMNIGTALDRVRRGQVHERPKVDSDRLPRRRSLRDDERIAERELEIVRREHVRDVAGERTQPPLPRPRRKPDEEETADLIESLCRSKGWAAPAVALRELKKGGGPS